MYGWLVDENAGRNPLSLLSSRLYWLGEISTRTTNCLESRTYLQTQRHQIPVGYHSEHRIKSHILYRHDSLEWKGTVVTGFQQRRCQYMIAAWHIYCNKIKSLWFSSNYLVSYGGLRTVMKKLRQVRVFQSRPRQVGAKNCIWEHGAQKPSLRWILPNECTVVVIYCVGVARWK